MKRDAPTRTFAAHYLAADGHPYSAPVTVRWNGAAWVCTTPGAPDDGAQDPAGVAERAARTIARVRGGTFVSIAPEGFA